VKRKFKIRQRRVPGKGPTSPGHSEVGSKWDRTDELTAKSLMPQALPAQPKSLRSHKSRASQIAQLQKGLRRIAAQARNLERRLRP